jgi:hypothetical protein
VVSLDAARLAHDLEEVYKMQIAGHSAASEYSSARGSGATYAT